MKKKKYPKYWENQRAVHQDHSIHAEPEVKS